MGKKKAALENLELKMEIKKGSKNKKNAFFWRNRSVLVTGGTGFIGSWLVKELMDLGARVIALDLKSSSPILDVLSKKLIFIKGDVRSFRLIKNLIKDYEVELIFHLAAQTIVGVANKNPLFALTTNVKGTWNILEASRKSEKVKGIVVASSDKAYGEHSVLPYREDTPLQGIHPYDVSKSCADLISQMYFKTYQLPVCLVRSGNVYGPGDLHFSRLIPDTIRSAFYNKRPIIRSDGKYIRDYIYIKDEVNAYLLLAQKMEEKRLYGQAFNLGVKKPYSVLEVVKIILSLMKKKNLEPQILDKARHEIKNQYLSFQKIKKIIGWQPEYALEPGLKKTINWYQSFFQKHEAAKGS